MAVLQALFCYEIVRILSNNACEDDIRSFIEQARKMTKPGDRNNIDAVLQISVTANKELYEKMRRVA